MSNILQLRRLNVAPRPVGASETLFENDFVRLTATGITLAFPSPTNINRPIWVKVTDPEELANPTTPVILDGGTIAIDPPPESRPDVTKQNFDEAGATIEFVYDTNSGVWLVASATKNNINVQPQAFDLDVYPEVTNLLPTDYLLMSRAGVESKILASNFPGYNFNTAPATPGVYNIDFTNRQYNTSLGTLNNGVNTINLTNFTGQHGRNLNIIFTTNAAGSSINIPNTFLMRSVESFVNGIAYSATTGTAATTDITFENNARYLLTVKIDEVQGQHWVSGLG